MLGRYRAGNRYHPLFIVYHMSWQKEFCFDDSKNFFKLCEPTFNNINSPAPALCRWGVVTVIYPLPDQDSNTGFKKKVHYGH